MDPDVPDDLLPAGESPHLQDAELEGLSIMGVDWTGKDAQGLKLSESRLHATDLGGASMSRARLRNVVVEDGSWANAVASDAAVHRVRFEGVRLTGANFSGSTIDNVTFVDCRMDLVSFRFAHMERVLFDRCQLVEADLYEASLSSAMFQTCDLSGVTLTGVAFDRSEMRGCDLSSAIGPQQLRGVRMPWVDVIRMARELALAVGIKVLE
jgi:uncharacterized protein YjbI with pentapeptide repeats